MTEQKLQEIEARCNAATEVWGMRCDATPGQVFHDNAKDDVRALIVALREARELCDTMGHALSVGHDAMMSWFSSEYPDSPKAKLVRKALDKYYDYRRP